MENPLEFTGRITKQRVRLNAALDGLRIDILPMSDRMAIVSVLAMLPILLFMSAFSLATLIYAVIDLLTLPINLFLLLKGLEPYSIANKYEPDMLFAQLCLGLVMLCLSCIIWGIVIFHSASTRWFINHERITRRQSAFGLQKLTIHRTTDLQFLLYSPSRSAGDEKVSNSGFGTLLPARLELEFCGNYRYSLLGNACLSDREVLYVAQVLSDRLNIPITPRRS